MHRLNWCQTEPAARAGLEISLGDFGAGATNLGLLRTLPVDVIKVQPLMRAR